MNKIDIVTRYLIMIAKLRDQTVVVGDTIEYNELVRISLNDVSPQWHKFSQVIFGWDKFPKIE
jgi:hypothetical protein